MQSRRHASGASRRPPVLVLVLAAISALVGAVSGAALVLVAPLLASDVASAPALPMPSPARARTKSGKPERFGGALSTHLEKFTLRDREGYAVLEIEDMSAGAQLEGLNDDRIVIPGGTVRGVQLLLRRGKSGRLSLVEAMNDDDGGSDGRRAKRPGKDEHGASAAQKELSWRMGPLRVRNVKLTVAMTKRPLIVQVDSAVVRVERKLGESGPRLFLSDVQGKLLRPDPLPQPLTIRGGEGVVDLSGGTFVDVRTRVCAGNGEMRLRIAMPEQHRPVEMTVDAEGLVAKSALLALHFVAKAKDEKLSVQNGPVQVHGDAQCSADDSRGAKRTLLDGASVVRVRDNGR